LASRSARVVAGSLSWGREATSHMSTPAQQPKKDLAHRAFGNFYFTIAWIAFLAVVLRLVWPLRNALLVCWVYGRDAYFRDGLHVLKGKPTRFSNGEIAPNLDDLATGALAFIVVVFGLSMLLILGLRLYERSRRHHAA
jgi:hypothetical protein